MVISPEFSVENTRQIFGMRLGEIIENVLGDSRIRELFDDAEGNHPQEFEGVPTGMMALDAGVISKNTKTALLVAQAAERTLQLAERARAIIVFDEPTKDERNNLRQELGAVLEHDDSIFKYVGSERDPKMLQIAQATWQIAYINFKQEVLALNDSIRTVGCEGNLEGVGISAINGLREAAKTHYKVAAGWLLAEGHKEAAEKVMAVSHSIAIDDLFPAYSPNSIANKINQNNEESVEEFNDMLAPTEEPWEGNPAQVETLTRLAKLADQAVDGWSADYYLGND